MKIQSLLFFFFCLFILSCQRKADSSEKLLSQATQVYDEIMAIDQQIAPLITQLNQERNQISIQGRALTPTETKKVASIESIMASYDWFEKNLVEIPGHSSGNDSHAGHNHAPKLNLTPKDMLSVQQEFLDTIKSIQQKAKLLLQK